MIFRAPRPRRREDDEEVKRARLEAAEREMLDLQRRADKAMTYLNDRAIRNHWSESINVLIRGGR